MASKTPATRDAGLRQVKTVTKWLAGGAAVLTGFFAVWAGRSVHDAAATTPSAPVTRSGGAGTGSSGSSDGTSDPGSGGFNQVPGNDPSYSSGDLQAPDYAPSPSDQPPVASSGGS